MKLFRRSLAVGLAAFVTLSPVGGYANNLGIGRALPIVAAQANVEPTVVVGKEFPNQTVDQVAHDVLEIDPGATVLINDDKAAPPEKIDDDADIQVQPPDTLNTALIYVQYGWDNGVYFVLPLSWTQRAALFIFSTVWLKKMDLQLGSWTRLMQIIEKPFKKTFLLAKVPPKNASQLSQSFAHAILIYGFYGAVQALATVPNLHVGLLSLAAQFNIMRKAGLGFASGFGWTMLERKWDPLQETNRPISRQAYTVFNAVRGMITGIVFPFLVSTGNNVGTLQFALHNLPYVASAVLGTVFYFWSDPILARYPQIAASLERFQKVTERINEKLKRRQEKIVYRWKASRTCAAILRWRRPGY